MPYFRYMLLVAVFVHFPAQAVEIDEAWMRAMPPGQPTAAAYVSLRNPDAEQVLLTGASTPLAGSVEIHRSEQVDGMWRMRRLEGVPVPAGGTASMAPGGVHLMLFKMTRPLKEGDTLPLTLTFDSGERVEVDVEVRALSAGGHHNHH